jgi:cellulose synthase/poly-beta-1,6-N-acetylglucosamine synthase-like glycosyltransferase
MLLFEGLVEFLTELDTWKIVAYFWPFFLIDMVRYLFMDFVLLLVYLPKRFLTRGKRLEARKRLYQERPLVSVLVPGKNEGKHIPRLAESLTRQTYKNIEIVVVDDGSDDNTAQICRELENQGKIDCFIRNEVRGGKASAANTALRYSKGKYLVHIDADSHLAHDAIETILIPFYMDPNIGAVGGDVRVANSEKTFATRLQAIEYIKSISTGRTVSSMFGILRIIAGAHGAFRRDVLDRIYGWDVGPGLDGDITLKIRKLGFRVVHEPHAVCYTNVPDRFRKLARQRFRWDRSMIRFRVRKHRDILLPSKNFNLRNFITSAENIFFNLLLNLKWWFYIVQTMIFSPHAVHYILIINYFLYLFANLIEYAIARVLLWNSMRPKDLSLVLFLPLMPLYTGIFIRIVRSYAYLMELIHGASYLDKWNPWKVSRVARKENL